jgi:hypothetical protein
MPMNPLDPIPSNIRQTILDAKESGLTRMEICTQYGFDWDVVIHCFEDSAPKILEKDMYHQGFRYTFKWVKYRHSSLPKVNNVKVLYRYLGNISKENYPKELFNDRSMQRISQFRLKRLKRGKVAEIGRHLIHEGYIQETLSIHELTKISKHLFADHVLAQKPKPSHHDIQTRILEVDSHSLAMEIPIWGKPPITPEIVTGHIDLIRIIDNVIYIVDYKPESNFMPSLPQVAFYGLLMRKNLNLKNIKCISFNNKKAWEFKPEILHELDAILKEHNINFFTWQKYI